MVPGGGIPTTSTANDPRQLEFQRQLQQQQQQHLMQLLGGQDPTRIVQEMARALNISGNPTDVAEILKRHTENASQAQQPQTSSAPSTSAIPPLTIDTGQAGALTIPKQSPATQTPGRVEEQSTDKMSEEKSKMAEKLDAAEKQIKIKDQDIAGLTKKREKFRQMTLENNDVEEEIPEEPDEESQAVPQVQQIIDENMKRKATYEASFPPHLRLPESSEPLYIEPCDVPGMKELASSNQAFRPKLQARLRAKKKQEENNQAYYEQEYIAAFAEWQLKDQEFQARPDRQAKEARWRTIFEATFKELSKQREGKERQYRFENRIGAEFLTVTSEEVDADKKKRNAAVLPPMLNIQSSRKQDIHFRNENHIQIHVATKEKKRLNDFEAMWTEQEIALFKNRLKIVGKNFANIAAFFRDKSVKDCVQCYYLLIKKYNKEYKSMLPKTKRNMKKKYKAPIMPTDAELAKYQPNADPENPSGAPLVPDVRCSKCQQKLDPTQNTIRVTRAFADTYGKPEKKGVVDIQICTKCHEAEQKLRSGRCLVKACFTANKKLKPTKVLPAKWKILDDRQKAFIHHDMGIPRDVSKTCHTCNKKIAKRIDQVLGGELEALINEFETNMAWEDDEVARLLALIDEMGTDDWEGVAEQMEGRDADECRIQYATTNNRKSSPDSEDEEDEAEYNETRENGAEDVTMEDETQDVPESEPSEKEIKQEAPMEQMDTSQPGPSVITQTGDVPLIDLNKPPGFGSITAGTPVRPSSVTILDSTPPQQPGPSTTAIGPPSTAPLASTATPAVPADAILAHIKLLTTNPAEQQKMLAQFNSGMSNLVNINPNVSQQAFQEPLLRAGIGPGLDQLIKVNDPKAPSTSAEDLSKTFLQNQETLNAIAALANPANGMEYLHLLRTLDPNINALFQQLQNQQKMAQVQADPNDIHIKFDKHFGQYEAAKDACKSEKFKHFLNANFFTNAEVQKISEHHCLTIVADSLSQMTRTKQEMELHLSKQRQELMKYQEKEKELSMSINRTQADINQNQNNTLMINQLIMQQSQLNSLGMQLPNMANAMLQAFQQCTQLQQQAQTLAQRKSDQDNERARYQSAVEKLASQIRLGEAKLTRLGPLPPNALELARQIHKACYDELQKRYNHPMIPTTLQNNLQSVFLQQLQLQALQAQAAQAAQQQQHLQAQAHHHAQIQAQAQAQQQAAAQKATAQAAQQQQQQQAPPPRKDNTWVTELEKQVRPSVQQRQGGLGSITKKVIEQELQQQQQTQQQHHEPREPMKRKSGLENVVIAATSVPASVRHQLHGPHIRRPQSPMNIQQLQQKQPSTRSITGAPITSTQLTVQTTVQLPEAIKHISPTHAPTTQLAQPTDPPNAALRMPDVTALRIPTLDQQRMLNRQNDQEPVVRKTGVAFGPGGPAKMGDAPYKGFPFVCSPTTVDRPSSAPRDQLNAASAILSPGSQKMTRQDNVLPTSSVVDVIPQVEPPTKTNGLLGEIEPMSPADSQKKTASPVTLGGEVPRQASTEPRIYSMMDDVYFNEDCVIFRPISPKSCLYPEPFIDAPFEDISDEEPAQMV